MKQSRSGEKLFKSIDKHKNRVIEDTGNILTNTNDNYGQDINRTDSASIMLPSAISFNVIPFFSNNTL